MVSNENKEEIPTSKEPNATEKFNEFLKHQPKDTEQEISKILFTGLDNSGKTSIILALQREISQIALLKPTRQAQRKIFDFLGRSISEWDLGGQKRYRIAYLKEPTKYFANTSVCIYVIDLQDKERLGESLSYLADVVKQFQNLEINDVAIYVFFHKYDPDFVKENNIKVKGLISDLKDKIRKIVDQNFNVIFMTTTIYDLWTIINSFSQILLRLYPQSELVDKTILEFAEKIAPCEAILILDSNSLVIGQYFQDDAAKDILSNSTPYFMTLNDSLELNDSGSGNMIVQRGSKVFFFDQFKIQKTDDPLFLLIMKSSNEFPEEEIQAFVNIIKSLI